CLRLGTGFVGCMSYQGKTCGAVTGAYMTISLINGNNIPNDEIRKEMTYMHIREFNKRFLKKNPSLNCNKI
ncbi:MAG: C_GCAxxG_C_C family protein, partial [Desulfobacterales bacterium]|nr:C_GCAxxG_C_C family protein [Desulfobacterales bacterium]